MADNDKTATTGTDPAGPSIAPSHTLPPPTDGRLEHPVGAPVRSGGGSWILLLLLIFAAAAGCGYWLWQTLQQREAELVELRERVEQTGAQLTEVEERVQGQVAEQLEQWQAQAEVRERDLQQALENLRGTNSELWQQLEGQQQRLNSLTTTSRDDWLLAEADYLLNLANQRVLVERDVGNAVALLRSADERLQQASDGSGNAELFTIRKALNEDLAALEKILPIDKQGLYLRLYALGETVDDLPRLQIREFDDLHEAEGDAGTDFEEPATGWWGRLSHELRRMVGALDRYVRIDSIDGPPQPLVDSYATQLATMNVRLLLEQAQLAVLQGEATIYSHSLAKAQTLLQQYYVDSEQNRQLTASLAELAQLNVGPELPDISNSFQLLRDYQRQQHRVRPAPERQP